jgi:hypothetical protein
MLPRYNQREHSMIPGVGPYSTLITPIAGSLFHAVFQIIAASRIRDLTTGWRICPPRACD